MNLNLRIVIDTHVHADHITASGLLRQNTNCEIVMGKHSKAQGLSRTLDHNDTIGVKGVELKALYTPGHTDDSYCYLMSDRVFTGDTLLIRGTGRTDFQHGDSKQAYKSLFTELLSLPEQTLVYPAHDYHGMTVSTIGEEKRCNPRLQVKDADAYAQLMSQLKLAYPAQMDVAVPANLNCGYNPS
jgi:sulfur dioxygenase